MTDYEINHRIAALLGTQRLPWIVAGIFIDRTPDYCNDSALVGPLLLWLGEVGYFPSLRKAVIAANGSIVIWRWVAIIEEVTVADTTPGRALSLALLRAREAS